VLITGGSRKAVVEGAAACCRTSSPIMPSRKRCMRMPAWTQPGL
jgi:hypothetical protein